MIETYEFRILEEYAPRLFSKGEGVRLGDSVRKILIRSDDPKFLRIGRLQAELAKKNADLYFGWDVRREYTDKEIRAAQCFQLYPYPITLSPEESGTEYDETTACPKCRGGAKQISDLFLPVSRLPKSKDVARMLGGPIVVSSRFRDLLESHHVTGVRLGAVRAGRRSNPTDKWFQLFATSCDAIVVPPTKSGNDPFDLDKKGEWRCPCGDTLGLGQLSELFVSRATRGRRDIIATHQMFGLREGLLRPERQILVSPRVRELCKEAGIAGARFEVVHLT